MFDLLKRKRARKVFIIGLDCAAPELVFDLWKDDLPTLRRLTEGGYWGDLESSLPCITVPAWSCMTSSKDPGTLGIYGFRNRADYTYDNMTIATGSAVREKRVWEILGEAGKQVILIGVPQTFPVRPVNGYLISSFLTPGIESQFTWPPELRDEVLKVAPDYDVDVRNFRTDDKDWLLRQIHDMTEKRIRVIHHLLDTKPWDFFMWVEMGVDRIHHGFWSYMDPGHRRYIPGNKFENAIHDYYVYLDREIAAMLEKVPDDTVVMVASDHGAKKMDGGICINEWLWQNGYLALKEPPPDDMLTPFEKVEVDWSKTKAWGSGGYYGRLFINVEGREPQGIVGRDEYEALRSELVERLEALPGPEGENIGTRVYKPQDIYRHVRNVAPDLIVYFGNLYWRSVGSFGHGGWHTFENDSGPDDCNHATNGMFILYDPKNPGKGKELKGQQLMNVAPTVLKIMGLEVPPDMQGKSIVE
jgi:predicted AlkP superfamily phosphohydrolase/phosphomutase